MTFTVPAMSIEKCHDIQATEKQFAVSIDHITPLSRSTNFSSVVLIETLYNLYT
jgi:hypothetical protein